MHTLKNVHSWTNGLEVEFDAVNQIRNITSRRERANRGPEAVRPLSARQNDGIHGQHFSPPVCPALVRQWMQIRSASTSSRNREDC